MKGRFLRERERGYGVCSCLNSKEDKRPSRNGIAQKREREKKKKKKKKKVQALTSGGIVTW